ncbi:MAG: hypothetical protein M1814_000901 [Vezdaea aestivalis]|nr:MAG: hypothetical protein M1814_000901 [Vezdaea aestivalis]
MLAAGVLNINEQTRSQYELWTTTTGGIDLYNYIVSSLKDAKLSDDILLSVAALHALEQFAPSFSAAQQPPTLWRLHNFIFNEHHYDPISAFHMVASIHGSSKYRLGKPWTDIYQKLRLRKSNGQVCGDIMYFFEERLTYKTHYQALKMARILSRGDDDMLKQCIADANHDSESESDDSGSEDDESGLKHDDGKGVEGSQQTATAEAFKDEIQSLKHSLNEVQSLFRLIEGLAGGLGHEMKTGGEIKLEQPKIQEMGQLTEINSHTIAFETAFDKVSVSFECFKGKLASTLTQESKCDETIDEQRKGCEGAGVEGAVCKEGETKESEVKESESGEAVGMGEGTRVAEADSLERADAEWESLERLD